MKIALGTLACALAFSGMVSRAGAENARQGEVPKPAQVCIEVHDIDHLSHPDNKTILFHMWAGPVKIWRNDLPRACYGLKFEQGIAYEIRDGEICSNMQVVYVLRQWTPCMLGAFTPYVPQEKQPAGPGVHP